MSAASSVPSVVLSRRGERLAPEPSVANASHAPPSPASTPAASPDACADLPLQDARKRFDRDIILRALGKHKWNVSRTADELGLERTDLHKKRMKALGIDRE